MTTHYCYTHQKADSPSTTVAHMVHCNTVRPRKGRMNRLFRPGTTQSAVPALILVVLLVLFAFYTTRNPLSTFGQPNPTPKGETPKDNPMSVQDEILKRRLTQELEKTKATLYSLQDSIHSLEYEVQIALGDSIAALANHPKKRPPEIDSAILRSDSFAHAFAKLVNLNVVIEQLDTKRWTLADIESSLNMDTFNKSDGFKLTEIVNWAKHTQQIINPRRINLHYLRDFITLKQSLAKASPERKEISNDEQETNSLHNRRNGRSPALSSFYSRSRK